MRETRFAVLGQRVWRLELELGRHVVLVSDVLGAGFADAVLGSRSASPPSHSRSDSRTAMSSLSTDDMRFGLVLLEDGT